jgi:hypothetical protein
MTTTKTRAAGISASTAAATATESYRLTVVRSVTPGAVGKSYSLADGKLIKTAVAQVLIGSAWTADVPDSQVMAELLREVSTSRDLVLLNGVFRGDSGETFTILTLDAMRDVVTADGGDFAAVRAGGRLYRPKTGPYAGTLVGARLKDFMDPSGWLMIDADEPPGFPDAWRGLTFQQRLELMDQVAPGLSSAERVELRGSSARVVAGDGLPGEPTHGWIRVDEPAGMADAALALPLHATLAGISFGSPRHARGTGDVIGTSPRTLIDLSTWHRGRLNFDSEPVCTAAGYAVHDAGVRIVNPGGGVFSPAGVAPVTPAISQRYREALGHDIRLVREGGSLVALNSGQLNWETQIEVRGEIRTLAEWLAEMDARAIRKLRCEAPFRASASEAAFIALGVDGQPFVFDAGTETKYCLELEQEPDNVGGDDDDFDVIEVDAGAGAAAIDPSVALTHADVAAADIQTTAGRAVVDAYREQALRRLNREIGLLLVEGKMTIVEAGRNAIGERRYQFVEIASERLRRARENVPVISTRGAPSVVWKPIFEVWCQWAGRRAYSGLEFRPRGGAVAADILPPARRDGRGALNLFIGAAWAPVAGDCQLILDHIRDVLCGGDATGSEYVLNWMARMVQQPERRAETVLVFKSGQGVGKGTIFNIFKSYFGVHAQEYTNDRDLVGFNDSLATAIFVSLNEATFGGNKQSEGAMKSIITDPYIFAERKYFPKFAVANCTHIIVSSNSDWVVPIGQDDRRYAVLSPSGQRVGDAAYFRRLHAHIEAGGGKALIAWLVAKDIRGFDPRVLPAVAGPAKLEQKLQSADTVTQWLMSILGDGGLDIHAGLSGGISEHFVPLGRASLGADALYRAYAATTRGVGRVVGKNAFFRSLYKILGPYARAAYVRVGVVPAPVRVAGAPAPQVRCVEFGPLGKLRDAFAAYMHEQIDWLDGPEPAD